MPEVRYTGGGTYRVAGHGFDPGNERDVDGELADYLAEHEDFEVIDDVDDGDEAVPILAEEATVDEIEAAIADVESPDAIRYVLETERGGQARTTAIEALEDRLSELEEAE